MTATPLSQFLFWIREAHQNVLKSSSSWNGYPMINRLEPRRQVWHAEGLAAGHILKEVSMEKG